MPFTFKCPACGQGLAVATPRAGAHVICPSCHGRVDIPTTALASGATPSAAPADEPAPRGKRAKWYASGTGLAVAAAVLFFVLVPAGVVLTKVIVFKVFKETGDGVATDTKLALADGTQDPNKLGVPLDLKLDPKRLMPGEMALEQQKKDENKLGQATQVPQQPKVAQPQQPGKNMPKDSGKVIIPATNVVIVPPVKGEPVMPGGGQPAAPKVAVPVETPVQMALRREKEAKMAEQRREEIFALNLKLADRAMEKRDFAKAMEFYKEAGKIKRTQDVMTGMYLAKLERDQALAQGKRDEAQRRKQEEKERVARVEQLRQEAMKALNNKEPARAMEVFKEALKLAPNDVVLQQGLIRTEQLAAQDQRKFLAESLALKKRQEQELAGQVAAAGKLLDKERQAAERQRQEAARNYRDLAEKAKQSAKEAAAESQKRFADLLRDADRDKGQADKQLATIRQQAEDNARAAQAAAEKRYADMLAAATQKNQAAEAQLRDVRDKADQSAKAAEAAAKKNYAELLAAAERQRQEAEQQVAKAREQVTQGGDERRLADLLTAAERQRKEAGARLAKLQEQADQSARAAAEADRKRHADALVAAEKQQQEAETQQKAVRDQAAKTAQAEAEAERRRFADSLLAAERQRAEAAKREKDVREQADKTAQAEAAAAQKRYEEGLRTAERQKQQADEQFKRVVEQPRPSVALTVPPKPAATEVPLPTPKVPAPVVVQEPRVETLPAAPKLSAAELAARKAQEEADLQKLAKLRAEADKAEAETRQREAAAAERKVQEERAKALGQKLLPATESKKAAPPGTQKSSRLGAEDGLPSAVNDRARRGEVAAARWVPLRRERTL